MMHEEANVIHGDLHLNNIVWDENAKRFFIIDFGRASLDYDEDDAFEDKKRLFNALDGMGYYDQADLLAEEWKEDF